MHVEMRCQFFGSGAGTGGQNIWPFEMEKSALDLMLSGVWGFQGPVALHDPSVQRYTLRRGGALLLCTALLLPAKQEHEVLQRVVLALEADTRNDMDWELHVCMEDDSHVDALFGEGLDTFFDEEPAGDEDPVTEGRQTLDFTSDEVSELISALDEKVEFTIELGNELGEVLEDGQG